MPNVTLSIEDNSPLLVYSDGWNAGSSTNDPSLEQYSQSNFMATRSGGARVTFVFTGSQVELFGAKRANYGQYQITVNDQIYAPRNGSNTPDSFKTTLFSMSWPGVRSRSVSMSNAEGNKAIDLDFITWIFPVGRDDEKAITNTFQDSDPSFKYEPESAWTDAPSGISTFSGSSGHATNSSGSSLTFTFEGDAISLFGPVGPNGVPYSVFVDTDGLPDNFTTSKPFFRPNTMLYHKANLGPGTHTLNLAISPLSPSVENPLFAIDYAQVFTAPSLGGRSISSGNGVNSGSTSTSLSPSAAAGISVGALLAFIFATLVVVWAVLIHCARRKNRVIHIGFMEKKEGPESIVQPFQYGTVAALSPPPTATTTAQNLMDNRDSYNSLVTPSTSHWDPSLSGGPQVLSITGNAVNNSYIRTTPSTSTMQVTQEITIPPRGYEKSRREQTPQLGSPPLGSRSRQSPAAQAAANASVEPVNEALPTTAAGVPLSEYSFFGNPPPPMYSYEPADHPSQLSPVPSSPRIRET